MSDDREFPIEEEDLSMVEAGLSLMIDQWPYSSCGTFAEVNELRGRISNYLNPEPEKKKWKQGKNPLRFTAPDGKKYNLRVDDERDAFIARLNGEDE